MDPPPAYRPRLNVPRIRTIKPEFWGDEKMAPLSPIERLVFLGLISMADDAGRIVDNLKTIDGFLFPETDDSARGSLDNLARLSRITRYSAASGQRIIQITNWSQHQKVDKPSKYVLPGPSQSEGSSEVDEPSPQKEVGARETAASVSEESGEPVAKPSRESREPVAKDSRSDLRPTTHDQRPPHNTTTTAGAESEADETVRAAVRSHRRWPELAGKFESPAERAAILDFLVRAELRDDGNANGLIGTVINWASGEMVAPAYKKMITPLVIATACQEYRPKKDAGDYNDAHIWAYVTRVAKRFDAEAAGSGTSIAQIAKQELTAARQAAAVWRLLKSEGLVSANPTIARQRIDALVTAGTITDAKGFLEFLMALPRGDVDRARTDHYAEKIVAATLARCPVRLSEVA